MNAAAQRALRAIDRSFYHTQAESFSATRTRPWDAFPRLVQATPGPLRVLDVGCGNGRFARALAHSGRAVEHYLGVDESTPLLAEARALSLPFTAELMEADILAPDTLPAGASFNLIVVLGVLHHVPSVGARRALVQSLLQHLDGRGVLALSFFRFERSARCMRRLMDPREVLRDGAEGLEFEPGDYLMPFGRTGALRYCHMFSDTEVDSIASLPESSVVDRFSPTAGSDTLNEYLLLRPG